MKTLVSRFIQQEAGATAVEDDLIAPGIATAITVAADGVGATFTTMSSSLE